MQVVTTSAALRAVNTVNQNNVSTAPKLSTVVEGVLSMIASSTSLSPAEKKSFIQDLANIEKFSGGDPKLIKKLIEAITALVETRKPGMYPQTNLSEVEADYKNDLGTGSATSSAPQVGEYNLYA